ncbi:MAG: hypothetical protein IPJ81_02375 [Chitinophagaceae bacterium]|nr:hypothetical protein [Chitinophagaceae bacterium]
MRKQFLKLSAFGLITATLFTACKKDPVTETNEEEVITTLVLKLTPQGGGSVLEYKFDDADGPGGSAPLLDEVILAPNKVYDAKIILLNKTVNPVDTISNEVEEEGDAHRFYLEPAGANLTISNLSNDVNGLPLGLESTWTTGAASTGKIQITLRHYPAVPPNKAANDLVTSPKSSTDLVLTNGGFAVKIQ